MTEKDKIKIKKQKDATIEIEGEIDGEILERHRTRLFGEFKKNFEAPGFRKGHAPDDIAKKYLDENHLLEEAAYAALEEQYPLILEIHDIEPITPPQIRITKLAFGNPIGFTLTVGVMPEFSLPNYTKIAKKILEEKKEPEVSEKELNDVLVQVRALRAPLKTKEDGTPDEAEELTDEFVKTLGNFETVDDFKNKIRENLKEEKKTTLRREYREKIAEALVKETKITLPPMLLDEEVERVLHRVREHVEKEGSSTEDYFSKIKKTEESFRKEQREYADRQYKTKFILEKIAETEKIVPTKEEFQHELSHFLSYYQDIDPETAERYVAETLKNEKTLQFLESQDEKKK